MGRLIDSGKMSPSDAVVIDAQDWAAGNYQLIFLSKAQMLGSRSVTIVE
jgi:hypothetical protein